MTAGGRSSVAAKASASSAGTDVVHGEGSVGQVVQLGEVAAGR